MFIARRYAIARYMLPSCVCASARHKPVRIETTERIELVFGMEASCHTVLKEIRVPLKFWT